MGTTRHTTVAALAAAAMGVAGLAAAPQAGAAPPALPIAHVETTAGGLELVGTDAANALHGTWVDATTVEVEDRKPVTTGGDCWHPDPADARRARCTVGPAPVLDVRLNGGDDSVTLHGTGCTWTLRLGPGDDVADSTDAVCDGTTVLGSDGTDTFRSGTSDEAYDGGAGDDTVSYATGRSPVTGITVDAMAAGGDPVTEDVLDEVEDVVGTRADDTITGSNVPNHLDGGGGDDVLSGGTASSGADDADVLVGGTGDDTIVGGPGVDTVSYRSHREGVTADLDDVADDGAPGEADAIGADVEHLVGSPWGDVLGGDDGPNFVWGDPCRSGFGCPEPVTGGDDTIEGGGGVDILRGGPGDDTIGGGPAGDKLLGGAGVDALDGGPGADGCDTGSGGGTETNCEA
jgi:Ca2+-binding RTX toxin-like protein